MNTFQLQCFLAVASTLNFAKAAERLHISQPTVTNQIKSLEEELNVKLFNRSTRVVEITPEGQTFLTDAKSMMLIAEQAKLRFAKPTDGTIRSFSIGCGSYIQLTHLTDVIHRLRSEVPGLHPLLHVVPREQLFHLL
ncbi:MAG: LysR family transcriptional regulator, partial [Eubacteriales bacterium]